MKATMAIALVAALAASSTATLTFKPLSVPTADKRHQVRASKQLQIDDGPPMDLEYKVLMRTGAVKGETFGMGVNAAGVPTGTVSKYIDFSSLLNLNTKDAAGNNKLFMVSHMESPQPASAYISTVIQDKRDGSLEVAATKHVDFSAWGGLLNPCAGSVSPWQTHLGSEENDINAKTYSPTTALAAAPSGSLARGFLAYLGLDTTALTNELVFANFKPYRYGYIWEVVVDPVTDQAAVVKHYAMGRTSSEMANVMPDGKTTYIHTDGAYKVYTMFVADTAGDLSAGCLYAAKLTQDKSSTVAGGSFSVEWLPMGCTNDADMTSLVANVIFSDIFESEAPVAGACSAGFTYINVGVPLVGPVSPGDCLKLKPNMELAASRLETSRYAAYLGATTEFNKWEGSSFDASRNRLYVSISSVDGAMLKGEAGNDHIQLPKNTCGCVYHMDTNAPGTPFEYQATSFVGLTCGVPNTKYSGPPTTPEDDTRINKNNYCRVQDIASPDNLAYVPEHDGLFIGEDTSEHQNDVLWYVDFATGEKTRVFSTPFGAEVTSPYWYPNINGFSYLVTVVQHPYGESDQTRVNDAASTGAEAYVGYFGVKRGRKTVAIPAMQS